MCGKFTQMSSWRQVHDFSSPVRAPSGHEDTVLIATPMRQAFIVRLNTEGRRESIAMRWGFADRRAANPSRPKHMHARCETINEKPTFRDAFAHRRGLLFVRTFNEGEELPNGKTKQWTITPKDGAPLAIAVIAEEWRHENDSFWTFVMVTTPPNPLIARITDRMPAIVCADDWPVWLGESDASLAEVNDVLRTFDDAGAWEMAPEDLRAKTSRAKKQGDLL